MMPESPVFFDTDCLSTFLWVDRLDIVQSIYGDRLYVPDVIRDVEIRLPWQKANFQKALNARIFHIAEINHGTPEYRLWRTFLTGKGCKAIGVGESAVLSLVVNNNGILASNNLKDLGEYVRQYSLQHTSTPKILHDAYGGTIISEDEGNDIWRELITPCADKKAYRLPYPTFSEYLMYPS